ncbi:MULTISPECIES: TetR family transcriptional regulator [unclassified Microbacterium]|uniref:TetR/AcrR family transcriptional regulator n=1 Tax=unclassified Microbacterium TaxID=2609290 RepID=UPI000CFBB1F3|nr:MULTISPECIES: TetR family transcriptional regulator [unclassified Microbacterium]PQZ58289.1 TetR family transcriptional regulator [Microbacterium sp. MYb43]PQZ78315.1 TetR family transcriptional regulator [Microbacterium sp. MYb40]PRB20546.1 TetR family transcriptional regulator [Microbacterium sp. MYb54]PRB28369.1 TetR family transcriptional regulator [Microbacterium sp. MYb50]PRB66568.1 TetR family transcriptional regulator [Microbacterium sp. MYb24]
MTEQKPPRRRGRPRGVSDSRARIIAAAVDDFGEKGYDGATIRSIAARAGVDSALVHHYFGTKADLFAEAVGIPLRPDIDVPGILAGPRGEIGERLIRYVLEAFEQPEVRRRGVMLLRTAIGSRLTTPLLAGFLSRELLSRVARSLDADDADLRASLVASQIAGMLIARYVLRLPALAAASVDELVARVGPTLQRYLFD